MAELSFAWCFDHGSVHVFGPDGAWCTATWVALSGNTRDGALTDKQIRYGDARFLHELPIETHLDVMNEREANHGRRTPDA